MDDQVDLFNNNELIVSSFPELHMKAYDPTTFSIDLGQQSVAPVYQDCYNQFGTFVVPSQQEPSILQTQYPSTGLPTPEQQFAVLAQSSTFSPPIYQPVVMTPPPSEASVTPYDMHDTSCSSASSSASLPPPSPNTRPKSPPVKSYTSTKRSGRRAAQDLPYAPNLVNLNLNTTRRRTNSSNATAASATDNTSNSNPAASFLCDYPGCNKTFTRPYNLKSHRRTHTLERPFACDYCPKRFARLHDCNRHEKLHFGIKPYVCEHCCKSFARQDALNRHQKPNARRAGAGPIPPCASIGPRTRTTKRVKK